MIKKKSKFRMGGTDRSRPMLAWIAALMAVVFLLILPVAAEETESAEDLLGDATETVGVSEGIEEDTKENAEEIAEENTEENSETEGEDAPYGYLLGDLPLGAIIILGLAALAILIPVYSMMKKTSARVLERTDPRAKASAEPKEPAKETTEEKPAEEKLAEETVNKENGEEKASSDTESDSEDSEK